MKANLQKYLKDNQVSIFEVTDQEMETERWKWIKGFEGRYKISEYGNVKSYVDNKDKPKILSKVYDHNGYLKVNLHYQGKQYNKRVHRLVAEAYVPNPKGKKRVRHINTNKLMNESTNLMWY